MPSHSYLLADKTVDPAWQAVDDYLEPLLVASKAIVPEADIFQKTLESHGKNGIPAINVSPLQGAYLYNTALSTGLVRGSIKILEVGTLAGCQSQHTYHHFTNPELISIYYVIVYRQHIMAS